MSELMEKLYKVLVTTSETSAYHIKANSPEEAKQLVLEGDYDPYETVDCSVDNVEVETAFYGGQA